MFFLVLEQASTGGKSDFSLHSFVDPCVGALLKLVRVTQTLTALQLSSSYADMGPSRSTLIF